MKVFMTNGTLDYLETLKKKNPETKLILMSNSTNALAFHETDGGTIFKEGRQFEVIESVGNIIESGYAVLNHIPVTEEGRSAFEYRLKNRAKAIEKQPGFKAYRFLRPKTNDTYVILTLWESEASFKSWKESQSFEEAHKKGETKEGSQIFTGPSYVTHYFLSNEENS